MKLQSNNVWFTADSHYSHTNLIKGVTRWRNSDGEVPEEAVRDFPDTETMNELMIANINRNIDADDWLIHLGDWSFGGIDNITEFREQINCKNIVLILGNHDHHIQKEKSLHKLFTHVAHYEEMKVTQKHSSHKFVLCHYPIISWNGMHDGAFMLHGHQHLKGEKRFCENGYRRMDIGLCGSPDFRPYHLEEVINILSDRKNSK